MFDFLPLLFDAIMLTHFDAIIIINQQFMNEFLNLLLNVSLRVRARAGVCMFSWETKREGAEKKYGNLIEVVAKK